MYRIRRVLVDTMLIFAATVGAVLLRYDLTTSMSLFVELSPYLLGTVFGSLIILLLFGVSNSIWRFSSHYDHARILLAVIAIVCTALAFGFTFDRLERVARSIPILQAVCSYLLLAGSRDLLRAYHFLRRSRSTKPLQFVESNSGKKLTIVVIGMSRLTDAYLQMADILAGSKVEIAAVLGRDARHKGRLLRNHRVVGSPEDLTEVLRELETRGVDVDRIVLTDCFESLSDKAQRKLDEILKSNGIELQILTDDFLLSSNGTLPLGMTKKSNVHLRDQVSTSFVITEEQRRNLSVRSYWVLKRAIDIVFSLTLILLLWPLYILTALLVTFDVGFPLLFWQRRPGLAGKPFKIYKFRTMSASHAADGRKRTDQERTSHLGAFIRSYRLDEIPQLFSILNGTMSFVGPRPLLPHDQPGVSEARLLIRPGLTGWAQVTGGRLVSAENKVALDLWYIRNASFWLDLKIVFKTVRMLARGENQDHEVIADAWRELVQVGIVHRRVLEPAE